MSRMEHPDLGSEPGGIAERLAQLAVELHGTEGVEETAETVLQFALRALHCSHAGVALAAQRRPAEVPATTDPMVADIVQFQLAADAGPLVESMNHRATVVVADTETEQRWPEWAAKVRALGVRSVLDVPMTTGTGTVGVLALYSTESGAFGRDDEAIAELLARHASVAVDSARTEQNLARAVDARMVVGQAMGILMERYGIDAGRAFAVLRRYSQDTNTKLRDVAQRLIDTRQLPRNTGETHTERAILQSDGDQFDRRPALDVKVRTDRSVAETAASSGPRR